MIRSRMLHNFTKKYFSQPIKIDILKPQSFVDLDEDSFPTSTLTTKEELLGYFTELNRMRRVEYEAGELYKQDKIRGFCHLYIGQESIALGMSEAVTSEDPLITTYRDHCPALMRGYTPKQILAEMMFKSTGATSGKGGSMHLYNKKNNFYGGNGIVGAQISVGAGLAFALKYLRKNNAAFAMLGDGCTNQGQFLEATNMAGLWKLPMVYVIENNKYSYGTSVDRSSYHQPLYSKFRSMPGLKVDGMDIFQVREYIKYCKNHVMKKGPIIIEFDTYRYFGHSTMCTGLDYRTKDEILEVIKTRDTIDHVKSLIFDHKLASADELKAIELAIENEIHEVVESCKNDPLPNKKELYADIYSDQSKMYIRGVDLESSYNLNLFENK